jgi:hypothetical protein
MMVLEADVKVKPLKHFFSEIHAILGMTVLRLSCNQ